jgi:Ca2+-binding EF-hand superfamily protein
MKRKHQRTNLFPNLNLCILDLAKGLVVIALLALSACATNKNLQSSGPAAGFDAADANHDGKLSREEWSDFLVNQVFDSRDANHDGKLTEQEWTGGDAKRLADFKKRDLNHDGIVTKEEALAYGRKHGTANKMFAEADKNHDGYLSREEVEAYYASKEGRPD